MHGGGGDERGGGGGDARPTRGSHPDPHPMRHKGLATGNNPGQVKGSKGQGANVHVVEAPQRNQLGCANQGSMRTRPYSQTTNPHSPSHTHYPTPTITTPPQAGGTDGSMSHVPIPGPAKTRGV